MATVCAITVRSVTLAWVVGVHLACCQQRWPVGVSWTQRSSGPALPGLLVLRIGLVPQLSVPIPTPKTTRPRLRVAVDQGTHPGFAGFAAVRSIQIQHMASTVTPTSLVPRSASAPGVPPCSPHPWALSLLVLLFSTATASTAPTAQGPHRPRHCSDSRRVDQDSGHYAPDHLAVYSPRCSLLCGPPPLRTGIPSLTSVTQGDRRPTTRSAGGAAGSRPPPPTASCPIRAESTRT